MHDILHAAMSECSHLSWMVLKNSLKAVIVVPDGRHDFGPEGHWHVISSVQQDRLHCVVKVRSLFDD